MNSRDWFTKFTRIMEFTNKTNLYIYTYIYRVGFICKPIKEYKLVNLIIAIDQNNQGTIWIHKKYENMEYMESQLL